MDTNRAKSPQTASCMYTFILNQGIKHDQLSFRVYIISAVGPWWTHRARCRTHTEPGVLNRMLHVYSNFQSTGAKISILRWYTISTVSPWTQTELGVLRPHAACIYCHPQSTENIMTSSPLECILFPPSVHGHKQRQVSSACMLHVYSHPQSIDKT